MRTRYPLTAVLMLTTVAMTIEPVHAQDDPGLVKLDHAGRYLDAREQEWFASARCVSCHTALPYAIARPALRKLSEQQTPSVQEIKLLELVERRVENWKDLDSKEYGLYYDDSDLKKTQSWATESVFNAVILAFDDRYQSRSSPTARTLKAFRNLWATQITSGEHQGSWEWLDFEEAPWGNREARYYGATLAAIACGTAPGYYKPGTDSDLDASVSLLRAYLKKDYSKQNLHNGVWALWADLQISGILEASERKAITAQLLDKQQADGGWNLSSLGHWKRNDGSAQSTTSDGYATGLVLHVLQSAGLSRNHPQIAAGLKWIQNNQAPNGAWNSISVVKQRDPKSHAGQFMTDAATAFVVLALDH